MLDVKRLRVLREVAARGSFSGAADALSYTQSAISQQIAALEREAGARLVERSAAASLLPLAIAEFRRRHPAVELSLSPGEPADAVAALKAGGCDLAISLEASFRPLEDEQIAKTM